MRRLITVAAFAVVVHQIDTLRRIVMATQAENQAQIDRLADQLDKARGEIVAAIADLKAQAESGQALDFGRVDAAAQSLDDLNPDPAPEPETPAE